MERKDEIKPDVTSEDPAPETGGGPEASAPTFRTEPQDEGGPTEPKQEGASGTGEPSGEPASGTGPVKGEGKSSDEPDPDKDPGEEKDKPSGESGSEAEGEAPKNPQYGPVAFAMSALSSVCPWCGGDSHLLVCNCANAERCQLIIRGFDALLEPEGNSSETEPYNMLYNMLQELERGPAHVVDEDEEKVEDAPDQAEEEEEVEQPPAEATAPAIPLATLEKIMAVCAPDSDLHATGGTCDHCSLVERLASHGLKDNLDGGFTNPLRRDVLRRHPKLWEREVFADLKPYVLDDEHLEVYDPSLHLRQMDCWTGNGWKHINWGWLNDFENIWDTHSIANTSITLSGFLRRKALYSVGMDAGGWVPLDLIRHDSKNQGSLQASRRRLPYGEPLLGQRHGCVHASL